MKEENTGVPGRILPPPLFVLALLIFSFVLHWNIPLLIRSSYRDLWLFVGVIMITASGVLAYCARRIMLSHKTSITFKEPTAVIISKGPFRFTRNPLYVSLIMLYAGIGLGANNLWVFVFLVVLIISLHHVVTREEKYLEHIFGNEFISYKKSVRRWF